MFSGLHSRGCIIGVASPPASRGCTSSTSTSTSDGLCTPPVAGATHQAAHRTPCHPWQSARARAANSACTEQAFMQHAQTPTRQWPEGRRRAVAFKWKAPARCTCAGGAAATLDDTGAPQDPCRPDRLGPPPEPEPKKARQCRHQHREGGTRSCQSEPPDLLPMQGRDNRPQGHALPEAPCWRVLVYTGNRALLCRGSAPDSRHHPQRP